MSLHEVNPSIKAFAVVISILILSLFFDPITPLLTIIWAVSITFIFGRISFKKWILLFAPFLFIAIIYVWSTMLFPRLHAGDSVIWKWGFLTLTAEGFQRGVSLGLRVLSFATLSIMFTLTTKPTDFLLSLMQQCKLPPKLAYGIMAGYRFLPLIKEEFQTLQNAHRVRGVARARTIPEKVKQIKRYVIPLLAGAIRKAERTALAMESKGFTGDKNRIFYREITVSRIDWLFFTLMIGAVLLSTFISWKLGYLQFYNGEL
ncbi:energy-coupling factor transporter transmembrane protein EcfT [Neobacillus niacini]|uniref:energy-coupling factor transporter transmembrane component T family protein n=1 Tax=Neobacillus niacini TaxID=86668 RepID=UPI001C8D6B74|nr:energy-coupling factor transporter transmembrane component T [Neobacillus niacini]MBY0146292.1 energy-coupling factor transporter transmembrane protein EcfT [Neobacillus niacini]